MTLRDAIAERILDICNSQGITVNKLSTICGITQSTLSNILNTGSNNPTVSTVKKICDGVGMPLSEFFNYKAFDDLEPEIK